MTHVGSLANRFLKDELQNLPRELVRHAFAALLIEIVLSQASVLEAISRAAVDIAVR